MEENMGYGDSETSQNPYMKPSKKDSIIMSLERLVRETSELIPDSAEAHLPDKLRKEVYNIFVQEFHILHGLETVPTLQTFLKVGKQSCS